MAEQPFFTPEGDLFIPNPPSRGPWSPQSLNGRVIAGLIGCEVERRHGDSGFIPARMTVDMYRLPGFDPIEIRTRVVRDGRRIRVIDAEFLSAGTSMARATCQFLKLSIKPEGEIWSPAPWSVPAPADLAADPPGAVPWEMRRIDGQFGSTGQRRAWLREMREMVAGVAITPFQRVAAACDFVNPFANSGSGGLAYINSDVTLMLHRLPAGEWIGFESFYHGADDGVAVGESRLYDEQGPIGVVSCVGIAQAQAIGRAPR